MTITYTPDVANASSCCMFWKALRIYRGSIYKIIWRDLLFFIVIFLTIQLTSLFVLSESQQLEFKRMRDSFFMKRKAIPMHYVLGFFVVLVVDRWSTISQSIPTVDNFSLLVNSVIESNSERGKLMRRTAVRYCIASYIINLRTISLKMRQRFPTLHSIVDFGVLLKCEEEILRKIEEQTLATSYVIPLVWATNIINRARKEGFIKNNCIVQDLLTELGNYRRKLGDLISYDLYCIPLFYIQIVTLTIYCYFFSTIIGHQVCKGDDDTPFIEIVVSLISASLEFTFHVGWVKVAEALLNPFGDDDEDFEVDRMVNRNLKAAYMIVDYMRVKEPDSDSCSYDYPIIDKMDEGQTLNKNNENRSNLKMHDSYWSIDEAVKTHTEDKYFQIYENVPVTSKPSQLLPPSKKSSYVNYVNLNYKNIPIDEECASASERTKLEETQIYQEISETSAPLKRHNLSQSSSYVDYVNVIYKNMPADEVRFSESGIKKPEETNFFNEISEISAPLKLKNLSQRSSYVDIVNKIYENLPSDEVRSPKSKPTKLEEKNIYENIPEAPALLQLQPSSQSTLSAVYESTLSDIKISPESDAETLEESKVCEIVAPKPNKGLRRLFSFAKSNFNRNK